MRPDVHLGPRLGGMPAGFLWAALAWFVACGRHRLLAIARRLGAGRRRLAAAVELGILFTLGTTQWGWSVATPGQSPVLQRAAAPAAGGLDRRRDSRTCRSGPAWRPGNPYLGFAHPDPNRALVLLQERLFRGDAGHRSR